MLDNDIFNLYYYCNDNHNDTFKRANDNNKVLN